MFQIQGLPLLACFPIRRPLQSMKKEVKQTPPPPSPTADQDDGSAGGGDDRISALDDDLCELSLRLAHLNVRELVRTRVLSKR